MSLFQATAFDTLLGQRMGQHAIQLLYWGEANRMVVFRNNRVDSVDLTEPEGRSRSLDLEQVELATMRGCLVPWRAVIAWHRKEHHHLSL